MPIAYPREGFENRLTFGQMSTFACLLMPLCLLTPTMLLLEIFHPFYSLTSENYFQVLFLSPASSNWVCFFCFWNQKVLFCHSDWLLGLVGIYRQKLLLVWGNSVSCCYQYFILNCPLCICLPFGKLSLFCQPCNLSVCCPLEVRGSTASSLGKLLLATIPPTATVLTSRRHGLSDAAADVKDTFFTKRGSESNSDWKVKGKLLLSQPSPDAAVKKASSSNWK